MDGKPNLFDLLARTLKTTNNEPISNMLSKVNPIDNPLPVKIQNSNGIALLLITKERLFKKEDTKNPLLSPLKNLRSLLRNDIVNTRIYQILLNQHTGSITFNLKYI